MTPAELVTAFTDDPGLTVNDLAVRSGHDWRQVKKLLIRGGVTDLYRKRKRRRPTHRKGKSLCPRCEMLSNGGLCCWCRAEGR